MPIQLHSDKSVAVYSGVCHIELIFAFKTEILLSIVLYLNDTVL